jgi:hypothetical protein
MQFSTGNGKPETRNLKGGRTPDIYNKELYIAKYMRYGAAYESQNDSACADGS